MNVYTSVSTPISTCQDCSSPFPIPTPTSQAKYCPPCRANHKRKPAKYIWTESRITYLQQHYQPGRRNTAKLICRVFNWPKWVVTRKAAELGLTYSTDKKPWTSDETSFLLLHAGTRPISWVARQLKRNLQSVASKLKREGIRYKYEDGYTLRELELCFGVGHRTIRKWVDDGKLTCKRREYVEGQDVRSRDGWCVGDADLIHFIKSHPYEFPLSRVDQLWFMDLVLSGEFRECKEIST